MSSPSLLRPSKNSTLVTVPLTVLALAVSTRLEVVSKLMTALLAGPVMTAVKGAVTPLKVPDNSKANVMSELATVC